MKAIQATGLATGVACFLAASATAQSPIKLLAEGDAGWSGTMVVVNIQNVDVNDSGDWLVEADGGDDSSNDQGIVHNGTLIFQEGTNLGFPASHTMTGGNDWVAGSSFDEVDINDNGDILIGCTSSVDVNAVLPNRKIVMWRSGTSGTTYALLEEDVTPVDGLIVPMGSGLDEPMGAVWDSIAEVWQNNNNQMVVTGRTSTDADDIYVFLEHDGAGTILSQTLLATDNVIHSSVFDANGTHADTVQTFSATKSLNSLNNNGQFIFPIDDQSFGAGGTPDYTDVDSHLYLYDASAMPQQDELAWEADDSPANPGFPYAHFSTAEVDINDSGTWVMGHDDDAASATDFFILVTDAMGNETIVVQEGDLVPDLDPMLGFLVAGFGFGNVSISDAGDVTYFIDWNDPDTSKDTGLFRNGTLFWQEGVSTLLTGEESRTISSSSDGMAVSDSGQYVIVEFNVEPVGGDPMTTADDLEGAFLFDFGSPFASFCNGDGGDQLGCTDCPCANNTPAGTVGGCLNSSGNGTQLMASGDASVSLAAGATTDLRFGATGAPANAFGVLLSGDGVAPTNMANPCFGLNSGTQAADRDGLRCAVGTTLRHGGRTSDANGEVGVTNNPWGGEGNPAAGIAGQAGFVAGQTRYFQLTHRDDPLLVCMRGLNTSQAVEVVFAP